MAICKVASPARHGQLHSVMGLGSFLLLTVAGSCWAHRSVAERYNGFVFNGAAAQGQGQGRGPVVWEAFMDPLCHNCKRGWPVVKRVAERYGSSLVTIVHPFPAPFHHNALFTARALHIAQMMNASLVYPLLELIFRNQETFSNPNTKYETPAHVIGRLISLAGELGISANAFEAGFDDAATDEATRVSFKYGCSRGVVGTPTFLANGVTVVGANDGWSEDDWAKIFDPMLNAPNT